MDKTKRGDKTRQCYTNLLSIYFPSVLIPIVYTYSPPNLFPLDKELVKEFKLIDTIKDTTKVDTIKDTNKINTIKNTAKVNTIKNTAKIKCMNKNNEIKCMNKSSNKKTICFKNIAKIYWSLNEFTESIMWFELCINKNESNNCYTCMQLLGIKLIAKNVTIKKSTISESSLSLLLIARKYLLDSYHYSSSMLNNGVIDYALYKCKYKIDQFENHKNDVKGNINVKSINQNIADNSANKNKHNADANYESVDISVDESMDESMDINVDKSVDKNIDISVDESMDESMDINVDKSVDKNIDKSVDESMDESMDINVDKSVDKSIDKSVDKNVDESMDINVDESMDKSVDKNVDKSMDKSMDKNCNTSAFINQNKNKIKQEIVTHLIAAAEKGYIIANYIYSKYCINIGDYKTAEQYLLYIEGASDKYYHLSILAMEQLVNICLMNNYKSFRMFKRMKLLSLEKNTRQYNDYLLSYDNCIYCEHEIDDVSDRIKCSNTKDRIKDINGDKNNSTYNTKSGNEEGKNKGSKNKSNVKNSDKSRNEFITPCGHRYHTRCILLLNKNINCKRNRLECWFCNQLNLY